MQLTIDGHAVGAPAGATILEVSLAAGSEIPRLCHDPRLKPGARCGLCVVEVDGVAEPVRACETPAAPGLVVRTATAALGALDPTPPDLPRPRRPGL